jgi:hypothetical protein
MRVGNLLLLAFLFIILDVIVAIVGWGTAFAFSYNVFVPWLGVIPPEYYKLAAVVCACLFAGFGAAVVLAVLAGLALLVGGLIGVLKR